MGKTIRAKVSKGVIRPLEDLDIEDDDKEVTITIVEIPACLEKGDALDKTAGGWVDLVNAEELKKRICSDREAEGKEVLFLLNERLNDVITN